MGRGGIGARRAQAQRVTESTKYALTGVPRGTIVAQCNDRYGRWEYGYRVGVIVQRVGSRVVVAWDDDPTRPEGVAEGDARYKVDRGLWRLTSARSKTVFDAMSGRTGAPALTSDRKHGMIDLSPTTEGDTQTEGMEMPEEMLSAKQVATKLGTDAKTFRRFLRATQTGVGSGGRYVFDNDDVKKLTKTFDKWSRGKRINPPAKPTVEVTTETKTRKQKADEVAAAGRNPMVGRKSKKSKPVEPVLQDEDEFDDEGALTLEDLEDLELDDKDLEV